MSQKVSICSSLRQLSQSVSLVPLAKSEKWRQQKCLDKLKCLISRLGFGAAIHRYLTWSDSSKCYVEAFFCGWVSLDPQCKEILDREYVSFKGQKDKTESGNTI